ncbi:MAG: helix-turn-helix domain-containing protein [Clostridia bacterium]|nr:helix-turn-helix domain-containing protein [Clostridia bacterium]
MKNNIDMNYVDVITQVMQERNLSQQALADIIGVNQTTVSQWLLGRKKPGYDNILSLYEKLGITPNSLFGID